MDSKLTLKLNKDVIESAKRYAQENKQSLSRLVERLLKGVTASQGSTGPAQVTPRVKRLTGALSILGDNDEQEIIGEYLQEKYR